MLLKSFDSDDIKNCQSFNDVFEMMGIGLKKDSKKDLNIRNEKVFGPKANYQNMFLNPETDRKICEQLKPLGKPWYNKLGDRMSSEAYMQWINYGPISNGPRYDKVNEIAGDIVEDILYILTPDDDLYIENPRLS